MAFGGPRSSCVRPGAHSARHQDSRNDWTPCHIYAYAGVVALRSSLTLPRFPGLLPVTDDEWSRYLSLQDAYKL